MVPSELGYPATHRSQWYQVSWVTRLLTGLNGTKWAGLPGYSQVSMVPSELGYPATHRSQWYQVSWVTRLLTGLNGTKWAGLPGYSQVSMVPTLNCQVCINTYRKWFTYYNRTCHERPLILNDHFPRHVYMGRIWFSHLSWETAFAVQKWWSLKTGSTVFALEQSNIQPLSPFLAVINIYMIIFLIVILGLIKVSKCIAVLPTHY